MFLRTPRFDMIFHFEYLLIFTTAATVICIRTYNTTYITAYRATMITITVAVYVYKKKNYNITLHVLKKRQKTHCIKIYIFIITRVNNLV